jgi:hypothetical protein
MCAADVQPTRCTYASSSSSALKHVQVYRYVANNLMMSIAIVSECELHNRILCVGFAKTSQAARTYLEHAMGSIHLALQKHAQADRKTSQTVPKTMPMSDVAFM